VNWHREGDASIKGCVADGLSLSKIPAVELSCAGYVWDGLTIAPVLELLRRFRAEEVAGQAADLPSI
jgi:hypothetical protein